jgi:hypothetical protein
MGQAPAGDRRAVGAALEAALAAARTLVERHGGRIRAAANPGAAGVQFLIDLPEPPAGP